MIILLASSKKPLKISDVHPRTRLSLRGFVFLALHPFFTACYLIGLI